MPWPPHDASKPQPGHATWCNNVQVLAAVLAAALAAALGVLLVLEVLEVQDGKSGVALLTCVTLCCCVRLPCPPHFVDLTVAFLAVAGASIRARCSAAAA